MTAMNYHRNHQSIFNFALVMAFWSLAAMLFFPLGKTLFAMPPMPNQTDPAVCQGFTLPPSSPELDQILAAQQAISEAVFPAGGANYLYCKEGTWLLDEELNETKEIHSGTDNPISGVTYGGDTFLIYPFSVADVDITTLGLDPDQLQWAQDNNFTISLADGIIESSMGRTGFEGMYIGVDSNDGNGGRTRTLLPYGTTVAYDFLFAVLYEQGFAYNGYDITTLDGCLNVAKRNYLICDVPNCNDANNLCKLAVVAGAALAVAVCIATAIVITYYGGVLGPAYSAKCLAAIAVEIVAGIVLCSGFLVSCMASAQTKLINQQCLCFLEFGHTWP